PETPATELSTLSLHDALPIFRADPDAGRPADGERHLARVGQHADRVFERLAGSESVGRGAGDDRRLGARGERVEFDRVEPLTGRDRKSTRLNSSHRTSSYAVF